VKTAQSAKVVTHKPKARIKRKHIAPDDDELVYERSYRRATRSSRSGWFSDDD
jgi:hypothetical protein